MRVQCLGPDLSCSFNNGSPRSFGHGRRRLINTQAFLAGSDRRVLGVLREASPRARRHRNPHPRGTLAWGTVAGSGTM